MNSNKKTNKKKSASKANKLSKPPTTKRAQIDLATPTNNSEVINCVLNPYVLQQFFVGYYSRGQVDSDTTISASLISDLVFTSLSILNSNDISNYGVRSMPSHLVQLYHSTRTQIRGRFTFQCNTTALNQFLSSVASVGWTGVGAQDIVYPNAAPNASGFYPCGNIPVQLTSVSLRDAFAQYGSAFDMVDVVTTKGVSPDIYAYDTYPNIPQASIPPNAVAPLHLAGYTSGSAQMFGRQGSDLRLEVPFSKDPWMAMIRACTYTGYIYNNQVVGTDTSRDGKHHLDVNIFPSVLGHQLGSAKQKPYLDNVMLKLCPLARSLSDIVGRLEKAVGYANITSQWTASFTAQEVKLLAYGLWRTSNARYGGAAYGVYAASPGAANSIETQFDSSGYRQFQDLRIPKIVNDCLQTQKVYSDKDGVLLPCFVRVADLIGSFNVSLTYTGTGVTTVPVDSTSASYRYFSRAMDIIIKYKAFEQALAGVSALTNPTTLGNSLLDVTMSVSGGVTGAPSDATVVMISSRRPLTSQFIGEALSKVAYLSYDYTPLAVSYNYTNSSTAIGGEDRTKVYRQRYFTVMSGTDTIGKLTTAFASDGFVPLGAEASNSSSTATSPITDGDNYKGIGYNLLSKYVPKSIGTRGNYGGPGFTAGSYDPADWKTDSSGKYIVPPVDAEDAIYKRHDEAVAHARSDVMKQAAADRQLYDDLSAYDKHHGLSTYGKLAKYAFSPSPKERDTL